MRVQFFELPDREHRTRIGADGPEAANPLKHHFRFVPVVSLLRVSARCLFGVRCLSDCGRIR
ncbi:hypothetical protein ACFXPX_37900, partial [Kitasatospora sp. NPDC059146]|uniref:hypothetical protein n=1 Tax=unclassified Kitasatospora TaxID=2633591 RepID=UPI0036A5FE81